MPALRPLFIVLATSVLWLGAGPRSSQAADPLAVVDSLWTHQYRSEAHAAVDSLLEQARRSDDAFLVRNLLLRRGRAGLYILLLSFDLRELSGALSWK